MWRLITVFSLILISFGHCAYAGFDDSTHYRASFSATGNFNKTNDGLTMLYNNMARFSTKFDNLLLNSSGNWLYGKNPEKVSNNDWNATMDFNFLRPKSNFYYWGLFNYTSSLSLNVNQQFQSGVGAAYSYGDNTDFYFSISDGIIFEFSDININDTDRVMYQTFRNSLRIKAEYKYKEIIKASAVAFHKPSLTYKNDFILTADAGVQVKLWKWLNFKTSVNYNKVSRTNKENMSFTYGLVAEHFF